MSDRSVWRRFMPRTRYAGAIGFCLVLVLNLSFGQGVAQDALAATGEALRERVARDGWVRVQSLTGASGPGGITFMARLEMAHRSSCLRSFRSRF
jgi:hypothetical protein